VRAINVRISRAKAAEMLGLWDGMRPCLAETGEFQYQCGRIRTYLATYRGIQVASAIPEAQGLALIADSEVQKLPRDRLEKLFTNQSSSFVMWHHTWLAIHDLALCNVLTRSVSHLVSNIQTFLPFHFPSHGPRAMICIVILATSRISPCITVWRN